MDDADIPAFALTTSRGFPRWLAGTGGSLAFTTYQAGKLFFLGTRADGSLSIFERSFPRAMGLAVSKDETGSKKAKTLYLATHFQVFRFDDILPDGTRQGDHDAVYAPHQSWITGDVDIHDMALESSGQPVFAATLFNCLATLAEGASFRPLWRPPFISDLRAEDRCHLNGVAMEDGRARFVTCVSRSDAVDGWRDQRHDGGVVVDVDSSDIIASGLSMPHSPRIYRGRLWLLDSGTGRFGWLDPETSQFKALCFCPGYARGLSFVGKYAVIGLSLPRRGESFDGLALQDALTARNAAARAGLLVVDLDSGSIVEWVRIGGRLRELFDVAHLPGVTCPSAIGLKGPEILNVISLG